jgi:YidC/Oxa1 family membrane protein insertase
VARQNPAQVAANPQAAMMNRLMVYLFPLGVVAGGPFFPLAILLYWLSNNLWTLAQQRVVYQWIDAEDEEKKQAAIVARQSLAPRPGQKPGRPKKDDTSTSGNLTDSDESGSKIGSAGSSGSGAENAGRRPRVGSADSGSAAAGADHGEHTAGSASGGSMVGPADGAVPSANGQGSAHVDGPAGPGMIQQRPRPRKKPNRKRR